MSKWNDVMELAKMLETEWRGAGVDRAQMRDLATKLKPHHPEIRHTLASVIERTARA